MPSHAAGRRTAILVLGMHRSGTSALAHLLARLGATPPADPNPPAPDNPEGYWEPAGIVHLNDTMLSSIQGAWLDTGPLDVDRLGDDGRQAFIHAIGRALAVSFGDARQFVLKDPRICRMVPLYRAALEEMGADIRAVFALRAPAEVAASLHRRSQMSADYAGFLWARHLIEAERETRDLRRVFVAYDHFMGVRRDLALRLADFLGLPGGEKVVSPARDDLRHHHSSSFEMFSPCLGVLLKRLHDTLAGLDSHDGSRAHARLDGLAREIEDAALAARDLLEVERRFQCLTSPYEVVRPRQPLADREAVAEALERLHGLRSQPGTGWARLWRAVSRSFG